MIKLLLALIMMFTFGTSTVNAEDDTASIRDRVSELADTKLDSQSIINAEVDELSEDELETVIANVDELTEPTEEDLAIKEAAISKLEEMKSVETSNLLALGAVVLGLISIFSALFMVLTGHIDFINVPLILGVVLIFIGLALLIRL